MDDKLISDLVTRLSQELPFYNLNNKRSTSVSFLKQNQDALLRLSVNKTTEVTAAILHQLTELAKAPTTSDENILRMAQSQIILLDLLQQCMKVPWDLVKDNFSPIVTSDATEKLKQEVEKESLLPPPISETLASELYKYISNEINKQHSALDNEIKSSAKKCLFYLSASNFSLVAKNIIPNLNSQNLTEEEIQTTISLLEYLNHNEKSLGMMIQMIGKALNGLKKSNIQILMAKILRTIIWSWIDNFPFQFISLCQSGRRMSGNPDTVFDIFDGWASNTAKKLHFWPVCTMLLVLCPDIMLAIVGNDDKKKKEFSSKSKFLEGLRSGLKSSKLTDISVRCYVDICTASTFVSKSDISALRYIAPAVE